MHHALHHATHLGQLGERHHHHALQPLPGHLLAAGLEEHAEDLPRDAVREEGLAVGRRVLRDGGDGQAGVLLVVRVLGAEQRREVLEPHLAVRVGAGGVLVEERPPLAVHDGGQRARDVRGVRRVGPGGREVVDHLVEAAQRLEERPVGGLDLCQRAQVVARREHGQRGDDALQRHRVRAAALGLARHALGRGRDHVGHGLEAARAHAREVAPGHRARARHLGDLVAHLLQLGLLLRVQRLGLYRRRLRRLEPLLVRLGRLDVLPGQPGGRGGRG